MAMMEPDALSHMSASEPVLCYVEEPWAWFTTCPIFDQWGDDWNDAPYEHNAGTPYEWSEHMTKRGVEPYRLFKLAFDGPWDTPSSWVLNSDYSVEDINHGKTFWLATERYVRDREHVVIMAGTPMLEFCKLIRKGGGHVYTEAL